MTAPAGYSAIRLSTAEAPNQLPPLPCVLVFADNGTFDSGNGTRLGVHDFIVRFYLSQSIDLPREMVGLQKWATVLFDQHLTSVQLGGTVVSTSLQTYRLGELTYAGDNYAGIEFGVRCVTSEGWAAVA